MHRPRTARPTFLHALRFPSARALALASLLALSACADRNAPTNGRAAEANANAPTANAPATQTTQTSTANANAAESPSPATAATPQASEVNDKIAKVFQGTVRIDQAQSPSAFTGDFNGDGSEDLAVVVRANADKLSDVNSEFANWILVEPQKVALPDPKVATQKLPPPAPRPAVSADEQLIAVVHGYQQQGWRNPAAQQTYLLKNAGGRELRAEDRQSALAEFRDVFPHLHSDILREDLNGSDGFICWTGAKYAWFPASNGKR